MGKAMKSLLNSGDTEKIIFFAGTARQCHSQSPWVRRIREPPKP